MSQALQTGTITFDQSVDLIAESTIMEIVDLGHSFLYKLEHPSLGPIVVVNASSGSSGLMIL